MASQVWFVSCIFATLGVATIGARENLVSMHMNGVPTPSSSSPAPAPAPTPNCFQLLYDMEDCIANLDDGSGEQKPSSNCCKVMKKVEENGGECICYVFESFGFSFDMARAADLSFLCGVTASSTSCFPHPPTPKASLPPTPSVMPPAYFSPTPALPESPELPTPSLLPPASTPSAPTPKSPEPPKSSNLLPPTSAFPAPKSPSPKPSPKPPTPMPATPSSHGPSPAAQPVAKSAGYTISATFSTVIVAFIFLIA